MYFLILADDRPGMLEQRLALRQAHIDYWNGLPGTVKAGGAMLEHDDAEANAKGSALIIEAGSLAEARALVAADPFAQQGIFAADVRVEVLRPGIGEWLTA